MKNIGILEGDLLAVHKVQQARNGQVVVARVDDDVTVKRFEKKVMWSIYTPKMKTIPRLKWI